MRMKSILAVGALLGMSLMVGIPSGHAGGKDCGELLGLRAYECTATDGGNFSSVGILAFDADASHVQGVNGVFDEFVFGPCYCGAKGNLKNPQIGAAAGFTCRDLSSADIFLTGTAAPRKSITAPWSWMPPCTFLNAQRLNNSW